MDAAKPGCVESDLLLVGESAACLALSNQIESAARTDAKVLILGETGSGKELVARLIHARSRRRPHAFVAINCSGIPESLLESELFGHTRGSFTGAYRDKPGIARQADRGTLFIDELGEMSARMQAVVLRFAETGEIQPIGSDRTTVQVDARLIAATHRDLKALVAAGEFRDDLYYRLNVIQIRVAPLRERREDIPRLWDHFIAAASRQHGTTAPTLDANAVRRLQEYDWPGNVRELKNVVERLVVRGFTQRGIVCAPDLPEELRGAGEPSARAVWSPPEGRDDGNGVGAAAVEPIPNVLWARLQAGDTFWAAVADPLRNHDLTRSDVRGVVQLGLDRTQGSYRALLDVFNLAPTDYKRLLSFLRQYDCHVPFRNFRSAARGSSAGDRRDERAAS